MLKHSDEPYFPGKAIETEQLGYYIQHARMECAFNGGITPPFINPLMPFHSVNIQPSNACPRNLVIFDQTTDKTNIMFHPEISSNFSSSCVDTIFQENMDQNNEIKPTTFSEDSNDIDALLGTEDDEAEECDDDEVSTARTEASTARTDALYECNSPEKSPSGKSGSLFLSRYKDDKKRKRIKKAVKALRRIVPGASRMSTLAVLDEAIQYLKSFGVELKKLGVRDSKS